MEYPVNCNKCKQPLYGRVKFCPFCGKPVEEISRQSPLPLKGPVIKGLSISSPGKSGRVVVTAVAHSEDGLNIARAEWWIEDDPGCGNGTPMEAIDGSFKSSRADITASIDISKFKPGKYPINVRSADVRNEWGRPQTIILTVPAAAQPATLYVSTSPSGAYLIVDGIQVGTTPFSIGNIGFGDHILVISKAGYEDRREQINIASGEKKTVEYPLTAISIPAELPLQPDRHLLRNTIVGILVAACLFIGYKMISRPKEKAQLFVSTIPSGASLTIDEKNRGRTPTVGLSIDPGPHRIVLEKDGYSRAVRDISLVPREKKSLKISLSVSKPPPPKPLGKERAEELVAKGVSSEEAGKLDEALILYREAREIYPDFPRINELIIDVQTKIRERRRIERTERQRKKAEELVAKAVSSEEAGRFEEALRLLREAKETYPDFPRINELIVDVQRKIEEHNRGKEADANNHVENDLREAIAAFDNSQYDVAIKMCQSILRKDPNNSTAQQYLQKSKEQQEKAINKEQLFSDVERFYKLVEKKNTDGAFSMFALKKQPEVNKKLIEAVAKDTEYYRIDKRELIELRGDNAKVRTLLYHKKYKRPEEYWEITVEFVKENNGWKIWSTPGKPK